MAILKKPEPKKHKCKCVPPPTPSSLSGLSGLLKDISDSREEMNKVQLATMKADLRKKLADAEIEELSLERVKLEHQDYLALRARKSTRNRT